MLKCNAKHTAFQPDVNQWHCPKCGSDSGFMIEDSDPKAGDDCDKVHDRDFVRCFDCDYESTGKAATSLLAKEYDMVPCPCCNGTGAVKRKEP